MQLMEQSNQAQAGTIPGTIVSVAQVGNYPAFVLRWLIAFARLPERIEIRYGVRLFRIQYWTTGFDNVPTVASGLVAIPRGVPLRGVVSYQHGTNPTRAEAPSKPTLGEGMLCAAVFAGGGYLLVAPDYIGLGTSEEMHPYLHTTSTVAAVKDLLIAARALMDRQAIAWSSKLFLWGLSQGGHASVMVHRALEDLNDPDFRVIASAPVAGPYNLLEISIPEALTGGAVNHALYLGYVSNAYSKIYRQPITSLLTDDAAELVRELFDGKHTFKQILAALPKPRDLFRSDFLQDFEGEQRHWFCRALEENRGHDWKPISPVRMFYGDADVDVNPRDAREAVRHMAGLGGNVEAVSVGNFDHVQSVYQAVPKIRNWFDTLSR
jgi:pimeloyl-ACP methyl ester carboxylesterase